MRFKTLLEQILDEAALKRGRPREIILDAVWTALDSIADIVADSLEREQGVRATVFRDSNPVSLLVEIRTQRKLPDGTVLKTKTQIGWPGDGFIQNFHIKALAAIGGEREVETRNVSWSKPLKEIARRAIDSSVYVTNKVLNL